VVLTPMVLAKLAGEEASPSLLLTFKRQRWYIENRPHCCHDVTLRKDRCRRRIGQSPRMTPILNTLTLSPLHLAGFRRILDARRCFDADPL
jgi:hypothetical protein